MILYFGFEGHGHVEESIYITEYILQHLRDIACLHLYLNEIVFVLEF